VYSNSNMFTVQRGQFGHENRAQTYGFPLNPSVGRAFDEKKVPYRNDTMNTALRQYNMTINYSNNNCVI